MANKALFSINKIVQRIRFKKSHIKNNPPKKKPTSINLILRAEE